MDRDPDEWAGGLSDDFEDYLSDKPQKF